MAIDQRDWYIEKLRRITGYVERAAFRVSLGEQRRNRERRKQHEGLAVLVAWFLGFMAVAGALFWAIKHFLGK